MQDIWPLLVGGEPPLIRILCGIQKVYEHTVCSYLDRTLVVMVGEKKD